MSAEKIIERMQDRMLDYQKQHGFTFDFLNEDLNELKNLITKPVEDFNVIVKTVCDEFGIEPNNINKNRTRSNADANKIICKVLNLKGYTHDRIAKIVSSKRCTVTARLLDYNDQYKFNREFQFASDNVFKSLNITYGK